MAEYIEKEALMVELCKEITGDGDYYNGKDDMQDQIRDMVSKFPAADVAPVRHGRWIWHSEERGYLCSECGSGCLLNYESDWHKSDWCPHCGAKMMEG